MKTLGFFSFALLLLCGCMAVGPSARINFLAPDSYPEGLAFDSLRKVYYVSSARSGTIGRVTPDGDYTEMYVDSNLKSTYGMKIHPDKRRLFICVGDANYSRYSSAETRKKMIRLISLDLETGKLLSDQDLSGLVPGPHFGNDLDFDRKGNAYVTDSYAHVIYKITPAGEASVFVKDKKFETEGIGINGISYHPNGFLLVDNSNTGKLYKVNLHDPAQVQTVLIDQFFLGADGLLLNSPERLTVVVNGGSDKVFQLKSEDNWNTAYVAGATRVGDRFSYPSTATAREEEVWVMNARFNEHLDSNSVPTKIFAIQKAVFKKMPKTRVVND